MNTHEEKISTAGYFSSIEDFSKENHEHILHDLQSYIPDSSVSQVKAWKDSLNVLKDLAVSMKVYSEKLSDYSLVLEYTIPFEQRRVDALLLLSDTVFVIEFKGKERATQADRDQATAYARDLKNYHKECSTNNVRCCLVLTQSPDFSEKEENLEIVNPTEFIKLIQAHLKNSNQQNFIKLHQFLDINSYRPLPSLIKAARHFFASGELSRIYRSASETKPAVETCLDIIEKTFQSKRRSLILINGVPGAGKTLVGLKLAYEDLGKKFSRTQGNELSNPISVFLSGPGPLSEVLQYELGKYGGGGKTFVRKLHDYIATFAKNNSAPPPHKILIYDEAQRAWDKEQVKNKQKSIGGEFKNISEPEILLKLAEKITEWSVVVCLVGSGQEIHIGEEGGLKLWKEAIENSPLKKDWDVFIPNTNTVFQDFVDLGNIFHEEHLHLDKTIRFHSAKYLIEFVRRLLDLDSSGAKEMSLQLEKAGYHLRMTHNIAKAKKYLSERFEGNREARYGMIYSSRDKDLNQHLGGIKKGFKQEDEISSGKYGQWFANEKGKDISCCNLDKVNTEFGVQGLELDFSLVAWGTDLLIKEDKWSNMYSSKYSKTSHIKNPLNLRINAYRVLLTRGREGMVVFVPPIRDKTRALYRHLMDSGFKVLE